MNTNTKFNTSQLVILGLMTAILLFHFSVFLFGLLDCSAFQSGWSDVKSDCCFAAMQAYAFL